MYQFGGEIEFFVIRSRRLSKLLAEKMDRSDTLHRVVMLLVAFRMNKKNGNSKLKKYSFESKFVILALKMWNKIVRVDFNK